MSLSGTVEEFQFGARSRSVVECGLLGETNVEQVLYDQVFPVVGPSRTPLLRLAAPIKQTRTKPLGGLDGESQPLYAILSWTRCRCFRITRNQPRNAAKSCLNSTLK